MMIPRQIVPRIRERMFLGKVILLLGARQVGKTTLVRMIMEQEQQEKGIHAQYWNCDEPDIRAMLSEPTSSQLRSLAGNSTLIVIDEAQRVANIGITLKLFADTFPHIQLLVTGSSALDLTHHTAETLTGRKFVLQLYPLSYGEIHAHFGMLETRRMLESMLLYGMYPDSIQTRLRGTALIEETLRMLYDSYALKDLLMYHDIRRPDIVEKLLQALAWQIGSQVSMTELSRSIGVGKETIMRYVQILEQAYIIKRLPSFAQNLRSELSTTQKIYFYDCGLRNACIKAFQPIGLRQDTGNLWENFLLIERMKSTAYQGISAEQYFWRTAQKQELDYIEVRSATERFAFEFKWNPSAKAKIPLAFRTAYPDIPVRVIAPDVIDEFLAPPQQISP